MVKEEQQRKMQRIGLNGRGSSAVAASNGAILKKKISINIFFYLRVVTQIAGNELMSHRLNITNLNEACNEVLQL